MSELKQSWRDESPEMQQVRNEFERQHNGRDLRRHNMRGTYQSATIAALWNQHLRTIEWLRRTQPEATKPAQDLGAAILAMNRAKLLPIWDNDVPHKLHVELDVIFKALAALASPADALVAGDARKLNWGDVSRPSKEIGYDHVIAQTPFGRVLITWKGWKDYPSFEIEDHPLEIVRNWCGSSLESAKEEAERVYFEAINTAIQAQKDGHG